MFVLYRVFFFNDTATTEIYTLSLHDALPILDREALHPHRGDRAHARLVAVQGGQERKPRRPDHALGQLDQVRRIDGSGRRLLDRKSTRLNSSHANISYAVFCLKKKKSVTDIR